MLEDTLPDSASEIVTAFLDIVKPFTPNADETTRKEEEAARQLFAEQTGWTGMSVGELKRLYPEIVRNR